MRPGLRRGARDCDEGTNVKALQVALAGIPSTVTITASNLKIHFLSQCVTSTHEHAAKIRRPATSESMTWVTLVTGLESEPANRGEL